MNTYLTTQSLGQNALPVEVTNGPHWIFWIGAAASMTVLFLMLTKKR